MSRTEDVIRQVETDLDTIEEVSTRIRTALLFQSQPEKDDVLFMQTDAVSMGHRGQTALMIEMVRLLDEIRRGSASAKVIPLEGKE